MVIVRVDIYRLSPNGMVRASPRAARGSDEERRSTLSDVLSGSGGMTVPSDKWFDAPLAKAGGLLKGRRRAEHGYTVNARPAACFYCMRHRRFNAGDVVRRSRPDLATTIRDCPTGCSIPANNKHGF